MRWHTETRKISELKNWKDNPRTITEEAFNELLSSIDDLGNFEPLVVNTDGTVLAGNQRLEVARRLHQEEVEVSIPERKLTNEEIKKIGLISNRHSGEWDMDKLANEFEDMLEELGFDDLMPINYGDRNEEIDINDFDNKYKVLLQYKEEDYNEILSLLSTKSEKLNKSSNEELVIYLLRNA